MSNVKLSQAMKHIDSALGLFMEVKSEIGVELANKAYKLLRVYEKYIEKQEERE